MHWTYAKAGVDIKKEQGVVKALSSEMSGQAERGLRGFKGFSGLLEVPFEADAQQLLAISTDGVGSKVLVAAELGKWDTIGIDCVAMNVNDIYCVGATPAGFVDYLAMQEPDERVAAEVGKGVAEGAKIAGISVVGGETAILPEVVNGLDLSGTCVGFVRKGSEVSGEKVREGDLVLGLKSSGIHSNGLTLARKVLEAAGLSLSLSYKEAGVERGGELGGERSVGEELLTPTRIYTEVLDLLMRGCEVHGLAHITGGGVLKLRRTLGTELGFDIYEPLEPNEIFRFIQELGSVPDEEMYKTFNMGMGFAVVIPESEEREAVRATGGKIVGAVVEAERGIRVGEVKVV
ncbi:MAG TPA: phosphoribosylformylglycinamidine cyclo-ligase [Methanomicrobia archaeon]|nr:phosphoribosylformylglycinamidine cyclo-ligase [Methanomicrobia archaeon]